MPPRLLQVELFLHSELLVNITRHSIVPRHELLTREAAAELLRRYQVWALCASALPLARRAHAAARARGWAEQDPARLVGGAMHGLQLRCRLCNMCLPRL